MHIEFINTLLREQGGDTTMVFRRNIVKEYLQVLTLSMLYAHESYQELIFYGGSALRYCYELPRLSEDLDFIDAERTVDLSLLARDLKAFFKKELDMDVGTKVQKFRVYLKFPLLHALGLASPSESDQLFLKVEVFQRFDASREYTTRVVPLFKFNFSLLVKTFDLPTLFATKIGAILHRRWEKIDRAGNVLATVKGRDYFDLLWYLEKGVEPNWQYLASGGMTKAQLKEEVLAAVSRVDVRSIIYDLEGLMKDQAYVKHLAKHFKNIVTAKINERW